MRDKHIDHLLASVVIRKSEISFEKLKSVAYPEENKNIMVPLEAVLTLIELTKGKIYTTPITKLL